MSNAIHLRDKQYCLESCLASCENPALYGNRQLVAKVVGQPIFYRKDRNFTAEKHIHQTSESHSDAHIGDGTQQSVRCREKDGRQRN